MKITVITINYNNKNGLFQTIRSVITQTNKDFEYIVIDGGSNDGSREVILEYEKDIDYWVSEKDSGIYNAMNKGIARAQGEYCIFMNSGDVFYNNKTLESIHSYLDGTCIINGDTFFQSGKVDKSPSEITLGFLLISTIIHQSTFIRTDLLKMNNYDEKYRIVSDWKFWLQELIIKGVSYKNVHIPVSIFDEGGISNTNVTLHDNEMILVLNELFPRKILMDYFDYMNGKTWEDKLYIEIKHSRFHNYIYKMNVFILKFISLIKPSFKWIKKYPNLSSNSMINNEILFDVYGNNNVLDKIGLNQHENINNNNQL